MKKLLTILIIVIIGALGFYIWQYVWPGQGGGAPRGGPEHNLTIKRSDQIVDMTPIANGADQKLLSFIITNHSSSTSYQLNSFTISPGRNNRFQIGNVRNIKIFSDGANIVNIPVLGAPGVGSSTPLVIPPMSYKAFDLRADIFGASTTSTTTLRIAVIGASAQNVSTSAPEPIFKEIDGRVLGPTAPIDDSIESAFFVY